MSIISSNPLCAQDTQEWLEFGYSKFNSHSSNCEHADVQKYNNLTTWSNCSVYTNNGIIGIKEESYNAFGDVPIEEHWQELINDEQKLYTSYK